MEQFWNDLSDILVEYYESFVALFPRLLVALVVLIFLLFMANRIRNFAKVRLTARMDDGLLADFIARSIKGFFWIIGFLLILHILELTVIAGSILAGAGLSAIILGFAFQDIGENFLAGVIMAFSRPFRHGDIIQTGDLVGKVLRLNVRDTQVKTFDGKDVFVPNGQILKNPLYNYTIDGFLRYEFVIGLDYEADISSAERIIMNALKEVEGILQTEKPPAITVKDLGASTINLSVYFWIDDFSPRTSIFKIKVAAVEKTIEALNAAGYYLPSDIIEIKNYSDRDLKTTWRDDNREAGNGRREAAS